MGMTSTILALTLEDKHTLEQSYRTVKKHSFRQRCKIILLKHEGYSVREVSNVLNTTASSINKGLHRFSAEGIAGLHTKAGQGRKPILEESHLSIVRAAVEQERQKLS